MLSAVPVFTPALVACASVLRVRFTTCTSRGRARVFTLPFDNHLWRRPLRAPLLCTILFVASPVLCPCRPPSRRSSSSSSVVVVGSVRALGLSIPLMMSRPSFNVLFVLLVRLALVVVRRRPPPLLAVPLAFRSLLLPMRPLLLLAMPCLASFLLRRTDVPTPNPTWGDRPRYELQPAKGNPAQLNRDPLAVRWLGLHFSQSTKNST